MTNGRRYRGFPTCYFPVFKRFVATVNFDCLRLVGIAEFELILGTIMIDGK